MVCTAGPGERFRGTLIVMIDDEDTIGVVDRLGRTVVVELTVKVVSRVRTRVRIRVRVRVRV